MKRYILILWFMALACVSIKGNEVKLVKEFERTDGTSVSLARSEWKKYLNRDAKMPMEYSIFRVRIKGNAEAVKKAKSSFKFDLGSQLMVKDTYTGEDNEIWFLVPIKAKLIYLQCGDGCEKCQIWSEQIEPDKVYYGEVSFVFDGEDIVTQQFLVVNVKPEFAMVKVDDEVLSVEDGSASKLLPFGRHHYHVSAENYHTKEDFVDVDNPDSKVVVNVNLDPAYGWINFTTGGEDTQGATIYIDGKMVGTVPMKTNALPSGEHDVNIAKTMYKSFRQKVMVEDNKITEVKTELIADFAWVTLKVNDSHAEIWVNREKKGIGQWSGRLASGEYLFETKKENFKTQSIRRNISNTYSGVIELTAPEPIYGKIMVKTSPNNAEIFLDGERIGTTPMIIPNALIGNHTITIKKSGYEDKVEHISIVKGETTTLEGVMKKDVSKSAQMNIVNGEVSKKDEFVTGTTKNVETTMVEEVVIECGVLKKVPKTFKGEFVIDADVTSIGDSAFKGCKDISDVVIPNSVTSIGDFAFAGCIDLKNVNIPNSVTNIGVYAFSGCGKITKPLYNNTIFAFLPKSYSGAYVIPFGIKTISGGAFYGCEGLTEVIFPSGLKDIGKWAFSGCTGMTIVNIPNGVESIGCHAFSFCESLASVFIPNSVVSIGDWAFSGCARLTSVIIPNNIICISVGVFNECARLKHIFVPNNVAEVQDCAFKGCKKLSKIYVPKGSEERIKNILPWELKGLVKGK